MALDQGCRLISPCPFAPAASHRQDVGVRRNFLRVMLTAIYGTTFPLGRRTTGCSGVNDQPAIHRA